VIGKWWAATLGQAALAPVIDLTSKRDASNVIVMTTRDASSIGLSLFRLKGMPYSLEVSSVRLSTTRALLSQSYALLERLRLAESKAIVSRRLQTP